MIKSVADRRIVMCLVLLLGLAGCGGGGGEATPAPPETGGTPPDIGGDGGDGAADGGDGGTDSDGDGAGEDEGGDTGADAGSDDGLSKLATDFDLDGWLRRGIQFEDRDGDGISDALDPLPDAPPVLADPEAPSAPRIEAAWTRIGDRQVPDVAIEGYPLKVAVSGTAGNEGSLWVAFRTPSGLRASRAEIAGQGLVHVSPPPGARGIHLIAGSSRSLNYPVHALRVGDPLLFPVEKSVSAGTELRLEGLNLERIERLELAGESLRILERSDTHLLMELPSAAEGNRLTAYSPQRMSNGVTLDLVQQVTIRIAADLPLAQGEELRLWIGAEQRSVSFSAPAEMTLPAWRPTILVFDIVSDDEVRAPGRLRAVVWPGDAEVTVSAESTLAGRLTGLRQYLPGAAGTDWPTVRSALAQALATSPALRYINELSAYVAGQGAAPDDRLTNDIIAAYEAGIVVDGQDNAKAPPDGWEIVSAEPRTPTSRKQLDSIVASTLNSSDGEGDAVQQTFGNDLSQITVLRHGDAGEDLAGLVGFPGCDFSDDETAWYNSRQSSADPYARVWRSDLCIQVGGKVFISAAVLKPGFGSYTSILELMSEGNPPPQTVRRHATDSFLDVNYQLGAGGYYLRADDGSPLCHMEECYIEIITSGYGAYDNTSLSPVQRELVKTLRVRMWVEAIIPWMLELAGIEGSLPTADCWLDALLTDAGLKDALDRLFTRIEDNRNLIRQNPVEEISAALDATVAPWARQYVQGQLGTQFYQCVSSEISGAAVNAVTERIDDRLPSLPGLSAFSEILQFVQNLGSAIFTPERFVFKIEPRAEITDVSPEAIDLYDDGRDLVISGDWLGYRDPNQSDPCTGEGWCPTLYFRDRYGVEESVFISADKISGVANCGVACTRLTVPYSELNRLDALSSGPLTVELAVDSADGAYVSYPAFALRIPVPGQPMSLATRAQLVGVEPPLVKPGEQFTVLGARLDTYGFAASWKLEDETGAQPPYPLQVVSAGPSEVTLEVDASVPTGQYIISLSPALDPELEDLEVLRTPEPVLVTGTPRPVVVVGDQGRLRDDNLLVEIRDAGGNFIRDTSGGLGPILLTWELPINLGPGQPEEYVYGDTWQEIRDSAGELTNLTALPRQVHVACKDGGADGNCTFAVRSLREQLCISPDTIPAPAKSAQVATGDDRIFFLLREGEACNEIVCRVNNELTNCPGILVD